MNRVTDYVATPWDAIVTDVIAEVSRARLLFPSNKLLLHAFTEEAGEVTKAFLDQLQKKGTGTAVRKELIQTIAMAVRLLQEGDPDFPYVPGSGDRHKPGGEDAAHGRATGDRQAREL